MQWKYHWAVAGGGRDSRVLGDFNTDLFALKKKAQDWPIPNEITNSVRCCGINFDPRIANLDSEAATHNMYQIILILLFSHRLGSSCARNSDSFYYSEYGTYSGEKKRSIAVKLTLRTVLNSISYQSCRCFNEHYKNCDVIDHHEVLFGLVAKEPLSKIVEYVWRNSSLRSI